MGKKSALVEEAPKETMPEGVVTPETTVVETAVEQPKTPGHPSRDFHTPING